MRLGASVRWKQDVAGKQVPFYGTVIGGPVNDIYLVAVDHDAASLHPAGIMEVLAIVASQLEVVG